MKMTVIFDFDGVIHSYTSGWKGVDVIPDPPVPGINEEIQKIRQHYEVVVVSTRCFQPGGIQAIRKYLDQHGIEVDDVTATKPPSIVSVDDRAICFDGNAEGLMEKIHQFQPWTKKEGKR